MLLGLTGGIASGKSLVASLLKKKGVPVIDADLVAREVVKPGKKAYQGILAVFGPGILKKDRTIDRQRLGDLVFQNEKRRRLLESITHPLILKEILARIEKLKKAALVVVDAALLFESGLYQRMDQTILVTCRPSVQLKRLIQRDRISEGEAWARILAQMPSAEKEQLADFVVDNSGTRQATGKQLLNFFKQSGRRKVRPPL